MHEAEAAADDAKAKANALMEDAENSKKCLAERETEIKHLNNKVEKKYIKPIHNETSYIGHY
jgi:hypothetical protein